MRTRLGRLIENFVDEKIRFAELLEKDHAGEGVPGALTHAKNRVHNAADELDEYINRYVDGNKLSLDVVNPRR